MISLPVLLAAATLLSSRSTIPDPNASKGTS